MAGAGVQGEGEGEGFWLPSDFLTDDDFKTESDPEFPPFPTELPYDFGTRRDQILEKFMMMASSAQSTNPFLSPPSGAKYDAVEDLIYLAAGEVAKLRLNRGYAEKGLPPPPRTHAQFYSEAKIPNPSVYLNTHLHQKQQIEGCGMLYNRQPMYQNGQAAWSLQQNPTRGRPAVYGGGAAAKRTCAGTGVFLPRRYENIGNNNTHSSEFQRKTGRVPIQVHPKNFANGSGFTQSEQQPQAQINPAFIPDYHSLMARRRHAMALQARRSLLTSLAEESGMMGRGIYLPQGNSDISGLW